MSVAAVAENGLPESEPDPPHENGVAESSVEDKFFEDISEPPDDRSTISTREAEIQSIREEDIPTLKIGDYSPEERSHLQEVLQRYAEMHESEGNRQQLLKRSLDSVSLKEMEENNNTKVCHCCGHPLTFLINPGRPCSQCSSRICQNCIRNFRSGTTKMCETCYLEDMHEGRSGKWFMKNLQKSGRSPIFGTDVLRASLKRHRDEEEQQRMIAEREAEEARQKAEEEAAAQAAAAQAAAEAAQASSRRSSGKSSPALASIASLTPTSGGGKKWRFGKKKKGSDQTDLDNSSLAESTPSIEPIHEERPIDVVGDSPEPPELAAPSISESDQISSMSHAVPPPQALEMEEATVSDPSEQMSQVPTIVVDGSQDGESQSFRDTHYVNEEDHIFPEDESEGENDLLGLRPPSHALSQESMVSIYSDTSAGYRLAVDVTGEVFIGLDYDFKHNIFFVNIKQARDIAAVDAKRKKSDPYVKAYLLPDKTKVSKRKTSYRKNTLNPEFNEQVKYVIPKSELETRVLSVAIWHRVAFGHNIFLGEAHIPMEEHEFGDPSPQWYPLHEKKDIAIPMPLMMYKGDLILAVKYVPGADMMSVSSGRGGESKGEVHAWIKEAKNLVAARPNGYSDPFCKGYLLPDKSKAGKKKTRVIKRNLNPAWNTVLRFTDVEEENLAERSLELTIWDYGRFSSNEFLGGLRLNLGIGVCQGVHVKWMDSKGHEITMWQAMISRPNTWIEGTLMLRPNMD